MLNDKRIENKVTLGEFTFNSGRSAFKMSSNEPVGIEEPNLNVTKQSGSDDVPNGEELVEQ